MSVIKIVSTLIGISENVHSPIQFSSFLSFQAFSLFLTLLSTHISHPSLKDSGKCGVKSKTRMGTRVPLLLHQSILRHLIRRCSVSARVAFLCNELQVRSGALFHQHAEFILRHVP